MFLVSGFGESSGFTEMTFNVFAKKYLENETA